jgi:hypothetical protein
MNRLTSRVQKPVKRECAEHYLLITLLSFAASVTLTRLFLELTDYPQLGGGEMHIAHVLWGGLLLFAAALIPLIIANRWAYYLGAVLCGTGVGLFIDEVGKFITANNDYFSPLAAPIIYALFLLTVLLYLRIRRPSSLDARSELYRALDAMEEVLEHDLDPLEKAELEERLEHISAQSEQPDLARLADQLLVFLNSDSLNLAPEQSPLWHTVLERWRGFEARWITRRRLKAALSGGLIALGIMASANLLRSLPMGSADSLRHTLLRLIAEGQIQSAGSLNWFAARLALEITVGLLLILAGVMLISTKDDLGVGLGSLGLLLSLTAVNLLIFYFDQFSTIVIASVQFLLLLGLSYYRRHFIQPQRLSQQEEGDPTP